MNQTSFSNYVNRYFNSIFKHGFKIVFGDVGDYCTCRYNEAVHDSLESVNEKMLKKVGYNFNSSFLNDWKKHLSTSNLEKFCSYYGLFVIPDFEKILKRKFFQNINHIEKMVSTDLNISSKNEILKRILSIWRTWSNTFFKDNRAFYYESQMNFIENGKNENMKWVIENEAEHAFKYFNMNSFFNVLTKINDGLIPESSMDFMLKKLEEDNIYGYINMNAEKIVDQCLGTESLFKKINDYIKRFENSVFNGDIKMDSLSKQATFNFMSSSPIDQRFTMWETHTRASNAKFDDRIYNCDCGTICVEYKMKNVETHTKRLRTWTNGCQFNKMNHGSNDYDYLDVGTFNPNIHSQIIPKASFVFASKYKVGSSNDINNVRYKNDVKNGNHMLLLIPVKWNVINSTPDEISNFIPDMDMNIAVGF